MCNIFEMKHIRDWFYFFLILLFLKNLFNIMVYFKQVFINAFVIWFCGESVTTCRRNITQRHRESRELKMRIRILNNTL